MLHHVLDILHNSVWALDEAKLRDVAEIVLRHDAGLKLSADDIKIRLAAAREGRGAVGAYAVQNGVAVIPIIGVIQKRVDFLSDVSGGAATQAVQRDLAVALADEQVRSILLHIDSPGGNADGVYELGEDVFNARKVKPVFAYADGLAASGAYWIASQAEKIYASKTALLGSIGVYAVMVDSSRAAENAGFKVNLVKAGEFKGAGAPGTPVSDRALAERQALVNDIYDLFTTAVALGRGWTMAKTLELADGRLYIADKAKAAGLADEVSSFSSVLRDVAAARPKAQARPPVTKGAALMAGETTVPVPAAQPPAPNHVAELTKEFGVKDPAFALAMIAEGRTPLEARALWGVKCEARAAEAEKAQAALAAENTALKNAPPAGVPPLRAAKDAPPASEGGDFLSAVDALCAKGLPRAKAVSKVAAEQPALHQAFVAAKNPGCEAQVAEILK